MSRDRRYQYLVEGECEKKLIDVLKQEGNLIVSGKVEVFNVIQQRFTKARLRNIRQNTIMVLVFDTDTSDAAILKQNIEMLRKSANVKDVWCVPQINNLEEELQRATGSKSVKSLVGSPSDKEFKHYFLREKNLYSKLMENGFDLRKMWISIPDGEFAEIVNAGAKIKHK